MASISPAHNGQVEDDWDREMGPASSITQDLFKHSIFEVVDVWTIGLELDDYVSLMDRIVDSLTNRLGKYHYEGRETMQCRCSPMFSSLSWWQCGCL